MVFASPKYFAGAFLVAAWALSAPAVAQEAMTAAAIQQSLGGKRVSLSCVDGTTGSGRYVMAKKFGTITGTYRRPGGAVAERDVGQVRADGDQLCLKFRVLNNGEERCFGVKRQSPSQFAFTALGGLVSACQVAAL